MNGENTSPMLRGVAEAHEALREIKQLRKDFRSLKGVLAESKITAFEMWREILEFL